MHLSKLIFVVTAIKVKSKFFQLMISVFMISETDSRKKTWLKLNFTTPLHWYSANHKRL